MRTALAVAVVGILLFAAPATAGLRVDRAGIGHQATAARDAGARHGSVEGLDTWLPFEVVLTNTGAQTYSGKLTLVERFVSVRRPMVYERRVTLGPGAHQRLAFPVLYDGTGRYHLTFEDEEIGRVELEHKNRSAPIVLPNNRSPTEKLAFISRRKDDRRRGVTHLEPRTSQNGIFRKQREWILADIEPEQLPERGVLYHRIDLVILDDLDLDRLTHDQQAALLEYAAQGGVLWISQLTRKPGAQAALLAQALPGTHKGTVELTRVRALDALTGRPASLLRSQTFMSFTPARDAIAWDDQHPVVVHRRHERGWIILAGYRFSEPLLEKPLELMRQLLDLGGRSALPITSAYDTRLRAKLPDALRRTTKKAVPPMKAVIALILGYLAIAVVVPFFVTRRSGRLEWAWVAVAVMSMVGTAAVFGLGSSYELTSRAVRVSLIDGGGDRGPHLRTSYWSVFSQDGGPLPVGLSETASAFPFEGEWSKPFRSSAVHQVTLDTHPQDTTLLVTTDRAELEGSIEFRLLNPGRAEVKTRDGMQLAGAWAWDAKGKPLRLELPHLITLEEQPGDPFSKILEVFKTYAQLVAEQGSRPVLLYRYASGEVLGDLPEVALDLGILRSTGWTGAGRETIPCRLREVENPERGWDEWQFVGRIPEGMDAQHLTVEWQSRWWSQQRGLSVTSQIYDWQTGRWKSTQHTAFSSSQPRFRWVSPLGVAHGRVRTQDADRWTPQVKLKIGQKSR